MRSGRRNRYDVAFYVPWIGPLLTNAEATPTGGAETQIYLVARALAERGVRVCLLAFELPGVELPRDVGGVAVRLRRPYQAHRRFGKLRESAALVSAIFGSGAGVIVTRSAGPHVGLAAVAAKLSGRRFVFSSANVSDFDFNRLSPNRVNDGLFRLGVRLADCIVVQTVEQTRMCEDTFEKKPALIKSIAEPAEQRSGMPDAFLWIARLVWYKRPLDYIELARSVPDATFRMVGVRVPLASGEDDLIEEVERAAAGLANLELLPPRPRQELMQLVDNAVAIVNTADFEGMPNIFLEGWSRGVPALALTHDPDGVIESNHVGWFAHGSKERLAELARAAWAERGDQTAVAQRCRAYVHDEHSTDAVAARWRDALGLAEAA
jgi:glycosyltransferase involved in cell wall biosynthesis